MNSEAVKTEAYDLGADLCGIASPDRFSSAPEGFRPGDIFSDSRSVLVYAKRLPIGSLYSSSCIPYTWVNQQINREVDSLTLSLSLRLESLGVMNVPVPSDDPSEYWESDRSHAKGILSLRHAGYLAGLGVLGKNTLLVNDKLGNMIQLGALLLSHEFEPDPLAEYGICGNNCNLCIKNCPQSALDGTTVDQQACRVLSNFRNERGFVLKKCWICRGICPHHAGIIDR